MGRAYWGGKIVGQTKDHFTNMIASLDGFVNRVGNLFGASDDNYEDNVSYCYIHDAKKRLGPMLSQSHQECKSMPLDGSFCSFHRPPIHTQK